MSRRFNKSERRLGGIAIPALVVFPVVLLAFVLGLSARQYADIHIRLQNEADAGTLAGADVLTTDVFLAGRFQGGANSADLFALLGMSRLEIRNYAQLNPVFGGYSTPDWNTTSPSAGDIQFGTYDITQSPTFSPVPLVDGDGNPLTNLNLINAVRVYMRRTNAAGNAVPVPSMPIVGKGKVDASAYATAFLDGDVYGIRPLFTDQTLRLMPFALDQNSIKNQTTSGSPSYRDTLKYNPATSTTPASFSSGKSDGIPEIVVNLTTTPPPPNTPTTAAIVFMGTSSEADSDFLNQITNGVLATQLNGSPYDGAFLLQPDATSPTVLDLTVPGKQYFAAANGSALATQLNMVVQSPYPPRIYPIYNGFDSSGHPIVTGFIAARLASVTSNSQMIDDGTGEMVPTMSITLTLQPTLISEPSAVTSSLYHTGYVNVPNQTIAKIRLVP